VLFCRYTEQNLCKDKFLIRQGKEWDRPGHDDRETFRTKIHQPRNAGVDGRVTFLGGEGRGAVNEAFSELPLFLNPNLWQQKSNTRLENRQDWLDLEEKMVALKLEPDNDVDHQRKEESKLRLQEIELMKKELREWQKKQPYKPEDSSGYHREIFSRCIFRSFVI
jgi:hypothetical protein